METDGDIESDRGEVRERVRDGDKQMRAFHSLCSTFKSLISLLLHAGKLFRAADLSLPTTTQL